MANLSLRGLDPETLARIRSRARRLKLSVNRLIVESLQRQFAPGRRAEDDIDRLAGTWTPEEADEFDAAVADFSKIDPEVWASQPAAPYRVRRRRRRR
jgi:hypothetical protein